MFFDEFLRKNEHLDYLVDEIYGHYKMRRPPRVKALSMMSEATLFAETAALVRLSEDGLALMPGATTSSVPRGRNGRPGTTAP